MPGTSDRLGSMKLAALEAVPGVPSWRMVKDLEADRLEKLLDHAVMDVLGVRFLDGARDPFGVFRPEISTLNELDHQVETSTHRNAAVPTSTSERLVVGYAGPFVLLSDEKADRVRNREARCHLRSACESLRLDRHDRDSQSFALPGGQHIDLIQRCPHYVNRSEMHDTTSQDVRVRFDIVDQHIRVREQNLDGPTWQVN